MTDAIVAQLHEYAETSAIAVLITSDQGRIHVVAKGAKRAANSFRGPLDRGVLYRIRLGRRRSEGLRHLLSSSVRERFAKLRRDPRRFLAASLVLEVAADLMRENEPFDKLFRLTIFSLKVLDTAPPRRLPLATALFLARAVALSGHVPETGRCVACGRPIPNGVRPLIGARRGGVLHPECGQGEPGARSVRTSVVELLSLFLRRPAREVLAMETNAADLRMLRRLLVEWLEQVLERRFWAAAPAEREFAFARV